MKRFAIGTLVVLFVLFSFTGCSKKAAKTEPTKEQQVEKIEEPTTKVEKEELSEEELFQRKSLEELNKEGNLKRINFDFDKYVIRDDMKSILQQNASWLQKFSTIEILIEGHCDEKGTVEYNMALGEKRAEAAMKYLSTLGVSRDKMKVVSYGKNKPLVMGNDEQSYFQNRRDEFTITKK